jgi:hypothetical protein
MLKTYTQAAPLVSEVLPENLKFGTSDDSVLQSDIQNVLAVKNKAYNRFFTRIQLNVLQMWYSLPGSNDEHSFRFHWDWII